MLCKLSHVQFRGELQEASCLTGLKKNIYIGSIPEPGGTYD